MSAPHSPLRADLRVLFLVYVVEAGAALAAVAAWKASGRSWLEGAAGRIGVAAALVSGIALLGLGREYARALRAGARRFHFTLCLNVLSVLVALLAAEGAVRALAVRERGDAKVLGTTLLPRSWPDVAAAWRDILREASSDGSWAGTYLVHDDDLGWTVGPDRAAGGGMYYSSLEGIRSGGPRESFRAATGRRRIALVGDSFTFGMDVPHEDTWAFHLGRLLGPDFQVLNFGVDGYGVDQAYLRYLRDARPWEPEIVLFGTIQDDFHRATAVYTFLSRPMWGFPFGRPRFVLDGGELRRVVTRIPSPELIFSRERIDELPHLGHEPGYRPAEWTFRWYHGSCLLRFLLSRFPRWTRTDERAHEETAALGAEILRSFLRDAAAGGSAGLLLYLPVRGDFAGGPGPWSVPAVLRAKGIAFEDLTECVRAVPEADRFVAGHPHYSPATNEAVARHVCEMLQRDVLR